ncbi:hypothetical protein FA95DRAFT_1604223 [Auriscalpium vulgare]|uniref:Uncharacterized protein n=1 Tax=Auriscalpium vulgare TaxID=40419 RepID=A0ACB8S0G3_9AGAM|nr:hypothetical protein FA95DRAFT_1604223 [Auriscalpium vulgare]
MATTPAPNPRASLLAGLRTGGVRSSSMAVPHTAAPGASFNVPRFASASYSNSYPSEEETDELADMVSQNTYINAPPRMQQAPMTAAVDGTNNRFQQQQFNGQRGLNNPNTAVGGAQSQAQAQQQAFQMQMMQIELIRLQAMQAQQYQAELLAQAQQQAQLQQNMRNYNPPATAGPLNGSFDLRSATLNSQFRRTGQADQLRPQLGSVGEDQVPMTAALGGKFGSRAGLHGLPEDDHGASYRNYQTPPLTPSHTTVISGGTSLGSASNNSVAPSKSDSAVSWRRGGNNNSVLSGNRAASVGITPNVKITPPPTERVSPPPVSASNRSRPQPLRFIPTVQEPLPTVAIDEGTDGEDNSSETSSKSGGSNSSPTTPHSGSSYDRPPLSPREEATKKLYEGLGIGRPVPGAVPAAPPAQPQRVVSQAVRQPRGPPSGADELGPRNFATRIRRKAIGGLGVLMDARERREVVEAY